MLDPETSKRRPDSGSTRVHSLMRKIRREQLPSNMVATDKAITRPSGIKKEGLTTTLDALRLLLVGRWCDRAYDCQQPGQRSAESVLSRSIGHIPKKGCAEPLHKIWYMDAEEEMVSFSFVVQGLSAAFSPI